MSPGIRSDPPVDLLASFLPESWPPTTIASQAQWKQGDLIANVPLQWSGPGADDVVVGTPGGGQDWDSVSGHVAEYGIVCSQTCDIGGDGPGRRHPFVQLAPVMDMTGHPNLRHVHDYAMPHLVELTAPPTDRALVADLRLIMPVSKALLLDREPIDAFRSEVDRLNFAEMIAAKHRRPAVDAVLSELLPQSLNNHLASADNSLDWYDNVEQVRIEVTGDRLHPTSITVFVISDGPLSTAHRAVWRTWKAAGRRQLFKYNVHLDGLQFTTPDDMTARRYRDTIPVRLDRLGRCAFW